MMGNNELRIHDYSDTVLSHYFILASVRKIPYVQ